MVDLLAAHRHASEHRAEIEASRLCGCFNCLLTFKPDEIIAWTGWDNASLDDLANAQGHTALCPHCGSESVIGADACTIIVLQTFQAQTDIFYRLNLTFPYASCCYRFFAVGRGLAGFDGILGGRPEV